MAAVPSIGRASLVEAPRRAPQAAATEGLYERHSAKILAYCRHQLGSREEAEDAVQTTFMNAFRALGRGVVPEAETAWLFKIAENVCLSRRRSSWRRGRIESPSDFEVIEEVVPGPSRQRDELIGIEDALASMPEQQRRAILLREWQGLSYREIAEELEVSQSAVETLIFRARRSLAQGLEQPETVKPRRKGLRRALHAVDLGTIAAALKTLLAGSAAVKATAAAVAVTAAAGTVATVGTELESKRHTANPAAPAAAALAGAPVEKQAAEGATSVASFASSGGTEPAAERTTKAPAQSSAKPTAGKERRARTSGPAAGAPTQAAAPAEAAAQPAPHPAAEAPKPESKPEQPAQAAQPDRSDEGKQAGEGKREETAAPRQQAAAPSDSRGGGKGNGKGRDKHVAPAVEAPAPSSVTASLVVLQAWDSSGKGERGGKAKESEPAPAAVGETAPAPAPESSVRPAASDPSDANGNGGDKGKGKGTDK